ncbi:MAG: hypothetical protein V4450_08760 [Bacteroidota bacterium]
MGTDKPYSSNTSEPSIVQEQTALYGFVSKSEEEKLKEDIFRPDIEKLQLFTRMLRRNATLAKAAVTHIK